MSPFQVYGKLPGHTLVLADETDIAFTVSIRVAALSHPTLFVKCATCVPAPAKVNPFHITGNAEGQTAIVVVELLACFTATETKAKSLHPF